jgi:DNA repair protein RadC
MAFQKRGYKQVGGKTEEKLSYEVKKMDSSSKKWRHPGGKLRELGPESLTDTELLAILISSGIKGRPAEKIAEEVLASFGSFKGMANQPLHKFLEIRGLGDIKIIRIAAAFEIARRIVNQVLKNHEK